MKTADVKKLIKKELKNFDFEGFLAKKDIALDEAKKEITKLEEFVKEHPLISVGGAVLIGYYFRKMFE